MTNTVSTIPSIGPPDHHLQILENELAGLKLELQVSYDCVIETLPL